jgi:opacity protein-like surface antigen
MRFLAIFAVSAALLTSVAALADPGQPQTAPAAEAQAPTAPAPTQTAQASPAPAAAATEGNLDQIECRSSPPPTGTRLGATRECHTLAQWKQREQDSQDNLRKNQMQGHQVQQLSTPGGK